MTLTNEMVTGCLKPNPRWRRRPYWISWKCYNSVKYYPKLMKFDIQVRWTRLEWMKAKPDAFIQIQDGRRHHLEFHKILYNLTNYCLIWTKCDILHHQNILYWNLWQQGFCATSKMAAATLSDFTKSCITQPLVVWFWRNLKRSTV